MRKASTVSIALILLVVTVPAALGPTVFAATGSEDGLSDELRDELKLLDIWIRNRIVDRKQPGLSIGIVHGGKLVWEKSYGFSNVESSIAATSQTLYRIASISKTFTATAILQLRDAGRLSLSDPVRDHLPWFRLDGEHTRPITIWQLLTHTSGLPREAVGVNWSDLTFPSRSTMIERIGGQRPVYPPETEWKYSNLGLSLAGEIVAAVSGQSWEDYIQENILGPLGMVSTTPAPAKDLSGLAIGYQRRALGEPRAMRPWVDVAAERPAGNMASNVQDMARYLAFHLSRGDEVLSAATRAEMHRVHWLLDSWEMGWGLGFAVERKGNYHLVGHGGSLPGHRTNIAFSPTHDLGVVVLTNGGDGEPEAYRNMAFELLTPALEGTRSVQRTVPDPGLSRYVGTYSNAWGDMTVLIYGGGLAAVEHGPENPTRMLIELRPAGEHTFEARPATMHFVFNGEVFRFRLDGSGRAVQVGIESASWRRID